MTVFCLVVMKNQLLANDFIVPVKLEPVIILMLSPPPKEPTDFSLKYKTSNNAKLRMWWKMKKWTCSDLGSVIPGQPRVNGSLVPGFGLFWIACLELPLRERGPGAPGCTFLPHDCKCQAYSAANCGARSPRPDGWLPHFLLCWLQTDIQKPSVWGPVCVTLVSSLRVVFHFWAQAMYDFKYKKLPVSLSFLHSL